MGTVSRLTSRLSEPVRRLGRWLTSDELFTTGSSLAFYALLSLPPMILIALWLVGAVVPDSTLDSLSRDVEGQAPDALPVGDVVRGLVDVATRVGFLSVLAAVWPATAYGAALARAFTQVAPESDRRIRGWRGRLLALAVIALLPVVVFAGLAVFSFGPELLGTTGLPMTILSAVLAAGLFAGLVSLIFSLFRLRDTSPSDVVVGALLTTGLQVLVTGGYVLYLELFADFQDTYGSSQLAVLVLLGLWLLLSNAVMLVGYRFMLRRCDRRAEASQDSSASPL